MKKSRILKDKHFAKKLVFLLSTVTVLFAIGVSNTYAKSLSELKKERTEIKKNQDEVNQKIKELEGLKSIAKSELDFIDIELSKALIELTTVESELFYTKDLLAHTEQELVVATQEKDEQYTVFKQRLAAMYENGNIGYLDIILESENFSDMMTRVEYINHIIDHDNNMVNDLIAIEDLIEEKIGEIEKNKAEIEVLLYEQEVKTNNLEVKLEEKNAYVANLESDQEEFQKQVNALDESDKNLEKLIQEEEDKERARKQAASRNSFSSTAVVNDYVYTGGTLGWPVPGRSRLSSGYISRTNPISGKREHHTGLDIPAPTGTSIVAAEDGTVLSSGWQNGYGYTVVISHGNGMSTLYAHNSSLVVSKGESVSRGQTVAKAGSTGYSTGPHCHFEVRINGKHTDPVPYLYD